MKKLMMALAVVACAAAAQASVVKWSSTAVAFNGTKLGNQTVQLYLVGVGDANDMLFDTRTTMNTPPVNKGKLTLATGAGQASYDYNSKNVAGGDFVTSTGADAGRQYYMVITYTDTASKKTYKYTSSAATSSGLSSSALGEIAFTFNDTVSTKAGAKDAWVVVPEPTSGLLMLLGFAGLALRRRRA